MKLCLALVAIAFCSLCAAGTYAFVEIGRTAHRVRVDEANLAVQYSKIGQRIDKAFGDRDNGINAQLTDIHRTVVIAAMAITNIEKGTRTWQAKQNKLADQALTDERSLNLALISTREMTDSLSDLSQEQASRLSTLENEALQSVTSINELSASIESQAGPTLSSIADASAHADSILAHGDHIAQFYDKKITAPVGNAKRVAKSIGDYSAHLAGRFVGGIF